MKNFKIWWLYFFGMPRTIFEFIVSVDLSNVWRQHLVWSKKNGDDLKKIVTERFASSTVFLSLLFSSEMGVLYSPSDPGKDLRAALKNKEYDTTVYWLGIAICFAIFFSVSALVANFTAMGIFSSLSEQNAPIVLRSTLGLYSAQLPSRLVTGAIYLFFAAVCLTWRVIMAPVVAFLLIVTALLLLFHIVLTFSAMGRIIMDSGAMGHIPILDPAEEEKLDPHELSSILIKRAKLAQKSKVSVNDQYKIDYQEMLNEAQDGKIEFPVTRAELDHRASIFTLRAAQAKMGAATRDLGMGMASVASVASTATGTAAAGIQHSLASAGSVASGAAAGVTQGVKHVATGAGHVATDAAAGAAHAATGAITGAMHAAAGAVHAATHLSNAPQMTPRIATGPTMPSLDEEGNGEDQGMEIPVETVSERDDGF